MRAFASIAFVLLGVRAVTATELYITELARAAYVDAAGRVVRVDLGLHPASHVPRWIELVESGPPER